MGDFVALCLHELPSAWFTLTLTLIALIGFTYRHTRLFAIALLGFSWVCFNADLRLNNELRQYFEGEVITVTGTVMSLPDANSSRTRFLFEIDSPFRLNTRISWYNTDANVRAGDRWQLTVKLKQPHGFRNPGGFDYEAWLFRKNIRATGYVLRKGDNFALKSAASDISLQSLRQRLYSSLTTTAGHLDHFGTIIGLSLGDRSGLATVQWDRLTRSGTNHLFAISGLHIGLIATLMYFLSGLVWRFSGTLKYAISRPTLGWAIAAVAACCYAAMAGFSLPTQRAIAMLMVPAIYAFCQRQFSPLSGYGLALLAVLLIDPFAGLGADFWLSFGAVGVIFLYLGGRLGSPTRIARLLALQVVIAIGLSPLLLTQFGQIPVTSALINSIAVPWIGLLVVPTTLFGVVLSLVHAPSGLLILKVCDLLIDMFWRCLGLLDSHGWLETVAIPTSPAVIGTVLMMGAVALLPARTPRVLVLVSRGVSLIVAAVRPQPLEGDLQVTALDVGQGLSVLVRTRNHNLLYDTGGRFSDSFNAGSAVIVPTLRQLGIRKLDAVIISHGDLDHRGGFNDLVENVDIERLLSGNPLMLPRPAKPCFQGQTWNWDGVLFEILHPSAGKPSSNRNDRSCVLRVSFGERAVLLPGDIEHTSESRLLRSHQNVSADILLAPHHGSASSSTPAFIAAVEPDHVVFPVGYRNRFGFPKQDVVNRYSQTDAALWRSDHHGAVVFELLDDHTDWRAYSFRNDQLRFWHHQAGNPAFTAIAE
ncbi:MAG: DNA internalization-related competence protein ComEC/Rec2 [Pseudomonadota bacterium]